LGRDEPFIAADAIARQTRLLTFCRLAAQMAWKPRRMAILRMPPIGLSLLGMPAGARFLAGPSMSV
jgi:hypothetical protein